ncbi:MAG: hypothetical protein KGM47_07250 [Acidobacteriota bacterium]|nr:hypothetical protein [Acidobacteriota bacterium]
MVQVAGKFGLQLTPDPASLFRKYFKGVTGPVTLERDFSNLWNQPLAGCPPAVACSVSFGEAISGDAGAIGLSVTPGVQGRLSINNRGSLFDPDPFGEPVEIAPGNAYVGFGITAKVTASASGSVGGVMPGFKAGGSVTLSNYRLFAATAAAPSIGSAIAATINGFVIPYDLADLGAMTPGLIALKEGKGTITFSAAVDLATVVNPLAAVSSEILNNAIELQAGASIPLTASFELSGDYQIRVRKLDARRVELGFYFERGSDLEVSAAASLGVSAAAGTTSLVGSLIGAISPSPALDLEGLNLSPDQIGALDDALKQAIDRELQLGIQAQLGLLSSGGEAFLIEADLGSLAPESQAIIEEALRSNLTPLLKNEKPLPGGLTLKSSVLTQARESSFSLKINLLGLYNYGSFSDFLANSTVATDEASGAVVITDKVSASRIGLSAALLTDENRMKLRSVLAESLLLTVVYRCGAIVKQPDLAASYWFFDLDPSAGRQQITDHLNALAALGFGGAHSPPAGIENFGRTALYLSTGYDDRAVRALFLNPDGSARSQDEYVDAGRQAMQAVLLPGGVNDVRRMALSNPYWPQVESASGNTSLLAQVFPDAPQPAVADVFGDWFVISNWADAMSKASNLIAVSLPLLRQNPDPKSAKFRALETALKNQLASMAKTTKDRFAEPWGMVALDIASGRTSQASGALYSAAFTLVLSRERRNLN